MLSLHIWFLRLLLFLTEWWNWYFVKGAPLSKHRREKEKKKFTHVLWKWYSCCECCPRHLQNSITSEIFLTHVIGIEWMFSSFGRGTISLQFDRVNLSVCLMGAPLCFYMMYNKNKYSSNLFVFLIQTGFCPFDRLCKYIICSFFSKFFSFSGVPCRIFFFLFFVGHSSFVRVNALNMLH